MDSMIFFTLVAFIGIIILKLICNNYAVVFIDGWSMYPALNNGDIVLIKKKSPLKAGSIYVFNRYTVGYNGVLIYQAVKRLDHIIEKELVYFLGDNDSDSLDSRHYGLISYDDVIGEVIKVLWRSKK